MPIAVLTCVPRRRCDGVAPAIRVELTNGSRDPGIQSRCVLHHHPEAAVAGSLDPRRADDVGDVAVGGEISWLNSVLFREDTLDSKLGKQLDDQQQNSA